MQKYTHKIVYVTAQAPYGRGETFIIDEMLAIKKAGVSLLIFPRNPTKEIFHKEAKSLLPNTVWLPAINFKMIYILFSSLISKVCLLKILLSIIYNSRSLKILIKNLAVVPKGVFMAELLKKEGVEHIHVHWGSTTATIGLIVSKFTRIPWSFSLHRWDIAENNMLKEKVKSAKFVRIISEHGKNELLKIIGEECKDKIRVIHMGLRIPKISELEEKNNLENLTIATPANLVEVKGHKYLIEACSILVKQGIRNFQCIFYGEGPLRTKLKNLIKKEKLTNYVKMPGVVPNEKLVEIYQNKKIDIVVLPSITTDKGEHEGIPVALMEAMAYRIPVISTNTGGIPELLSGNAGIIVEEKSSIALAKEISNLFNHKQLAMSLGIAGYKKVSEEFNVKKTSFSLLHGILKE